MKTLTLLRHAKSGWDDPAARDFDRPLNGRGERAAIEMGRYARDQGRAFDLVLASPAIRVVQTLIHFAAGYGHVIDPQWERRIYLASSSTLLDLIGGLPVSIDHALLVGHNPGLEDLVLELTSDTPPSTLRAAVETKFPTASLATLRFDGSSWPDLAFGTATLVSFVRPRDLDPALGPDDD